MNFVIYVLFSDNVLTVLLKIELSCSKLQRIVKIPVLERQKCRNTNILTLSRAVDIS